MAKDLKIKPKILLDKNGEKKGVLLKEKEFKKLMEQLEDLEDIYSAKKVMSKKFEPISFEEIKKKFLK